MHDESLYALRALRAGALGYVMKAEALSHVLTAIRKVLVGEIFVSPRLSERLIFQAINRPMPVPDRPWINFPTANSRCSNSSAGASAPRKWPPSFTSASRRSETHRAHIKEKLGFRDAGEMVRFAIDWVARKRVIETPSPRHKPCSALPRTPEPESAISGRFSK